MTGRQLDTLLDQFIREKIRSLPDQIIKKEKYYINSIPDQTFKKQIRSDRFLPFNIIGVGLRTG